MRTYVQTLDACAWCLCVLQMPTALCEVDVLPKRYRCDIHVFSLSLALSVKCKTHLEWRGALATQPHRPEGGPLSMCA